MLVDAHNHLELYKDNISKALKIINNKKIWTLACSMNKKDYLWLKEISKDQPFIIPCYGIHPWNISPELEDLKDKEEIIMFIKESPIIGEIGLDFFWTEDKNNYPIQIEILEFFFKYAKKYEKIVNLHTKGAEKEVLNLLQKYNLNTPIIHWYSGPLDLIDEYLKLDCYFTISVDITKSKTSQQLVSMLPINKLLTETDGPTALEWVNGNYAYPDYVETIIKEIAIIKDLDFKTCKEIINNNFRNLISNINLEIE